MKARKIKYTRHDTARFHLEPSRRDDERSAFERDRSRIIHSAAFRRLQGKTQVFTVGEGDFFRTRLTHSLEVAQIAKGLALRLGADTDLIETISLIHDIGHPPFGHAGENELKRLLKPYGGFEANAQNIRVLTKLESRNNQYDGLNLTRAVLDGQLKYKNTFSPYADPSSLQARKFIYEEDVQIVDWASREAQAPYALDMSAKSFDCEIMDWADDIAYAVHDLEDSIHAHYIDASSFHHNNIRVERNVQSKFETSDVSSIYARLCEIISRENPDFRFVSPSSDAKQRKANRKRLTSFLIQRYIQAARRDKRSVVISDSISNRYLYTVHVEERYRVEVAIINGLIRELVLDSPQVRTLEEKGKHIIRSMFLKLMKNDNANYLLPDDWKGYLANCRSQKDRARVVCDYICGMTDDYAQKTYARLFLPNQGSIYDVF